MRLFTSRYTGDRYRVLTRLGFKDINWRVRNAETWVGALRHLWHVFYDGELCMHCGRRYDNFLWWCESNELWHRLTGRGAGGLYCPACFDVKGRAHGLMFFWTPRVQDDVRFEPEFSRGSVDG